MTCTTTAKTVELLAHGTTSVVAVGRESVIVRDLVTHYEATGNGTYTLYARAGKVTSCSCKGHRYRGTCKHAAAVGSVLAAW